MVGVIYHTLVQSLRGRHVVYHRPGPDDGADVLCMFMLIGVRGSPVHGDFLFYIMSGVLHCITHVAAVGAVFGVDNSLSDMIQHAPMNTISVVAASLATLYRQFLTIVIVLTVYHIVMNLITIDKPVQAMGMFHLAWLTGCGVGLLS